MPNENEPHLLIILWNILSFAIKCKIFYSGKPEFKRLTLQDFYERFH